jgi:hypothetical protein
MAEPVTPHRVQMLFAGTKLREELARIYDRRQPGEYLVVVGRKL